MFRICFFEFLIFTSSSPSFASTLENYETAKSGLENLRAHFVQKKTFTLFEETETSEGEVIFKRPNRVIWRFGIPRPMQIILSGDFSWSVYPETRQIHKIQVAGGSSNRLFQILGFDAEDEKLETSFEVKELTQDGEADMETLSLIPKDESLKPYYSEIILRLSGQDHLPRHILLKEKSGDVTEILLSNLEKNVEVADSLFEFNVPEGFETVDYSQM